MDSFRTIAAVLVVLLAFTGFQLIANYSLRRSVREDVKRQMDSADAQMLRLREGIGKANQQLKAFQSELAAAADSLQAVAEKVKDAVTKSGQLSESVTALETQIKALGAIVEAIKKKLGALDGATDGAHAAP